MCYNPAMQPTILVYEDDDSILEVLQLILEDEGYNVIAENHCDNLDQITQVKPQLILIDLWIPELGGEEVCKQVKNNADLKHIPVMFISASNETETIANRVKADAFIHKPFDINEVKTKAKALLKK
jgi:DNA-binding response OmpR family regulator